MSIIYDEQLHIFHLRTENSSYLMEIEEGGVLAHLYYGKRINSYHGIRRYPRVERVFSPNLPGSNDNTLSLDTLLQETSSVGNGDFRTPSCQVHFEDGNSVVDFRYVSHEIIAGKPVLEGLPQTFSQKPNQAETLRIILADTDSQINLELSYTLFENSSVIVRSAKIINNSSSILSLTKLMSMQIDFQPNDLELMHFEGAWAREQQLIKEKISTGTKILESRRGTSSYQQSPSFILAPSTTTEKVGDVYGFCFVYSGNHQIVIEKDQYQQLRIMMGINPFEFDWKLDPGAQFQAPEVLMNYTDQGFTQH